MYRSLAFSAFFVLATASSLALSSSEPSREPAPQKQAAEFRGDRRPGILRAPSVHPVNPGENGAYYDFTSPDTGDERGHR